jgi:transcriptional regulator with XRE-family HTH domain
MGRARPNTRQAEIVRRFAARLREVRRSRGMTQAELGEAAGVAASYVGRLEAAGAAPGIDLVARLAAALGTTVHDLLPAGPPPDTEAVLRGRAEALFAGLVKAADRDTLLMLAPLLARLAESPVANR